MKKIFIFALTALMAVGCNNREQKKNVDEGAQNACQYVKEQLKVNSEDIESIEATGGEYTMSNHLLLTHDGSDIVMKCSYFVEGTMKRAEFKNFVDSVANAVNDIKNVWEGCSKDAVDSLKMLEKYMSYWRKTYDVSVTMKSGTSHSYRVVMDSDDVTPEFMGGFVDEIIQGNAEKIGSAYQYYEALHFRD